MMMRFWLTMPFALSAALVGARAQDTTTAVPSTPIDTSYVEYHDSPISLPLGLGLRIPTYDRVNGLTLPWGPKLETSNGRFDLDGLVSYRSNLGKWDPSISGVVRTGGSSQFRLYAGRGTFTNDKWIRDELTNTVTSLFGGSDARNYYRGDRASLRFETTFTGSATSTTPFLGGIFENDWSTGSLIPDKTPWSFYGRTGDQRMKRPNPPISKGHIASVVGGAVMDFLSGDASGKIDAVIEQSLSTSLVADCSGVAQAGAVCYLPGDGFTQLTLDGKLVLPTFGTQTFTFEGHTILTGGDGVGPVQRFGYLGGANTLPTVNVLAIGGDQLLFLMGEYKVPFEKFPLPYVGTPFIALRYATGNAGTDGIPRLIPNLGVGLGVALLRLDYTIDPSSNRSVFSRKSAFSWGLSLEF
jgi:hypothetical protein